MTQRLSNTEALEVITKHVQDLQLERGKSSLKWYQRERLDNELRKWIETREYARKRALRQP